ncbi:MAG: hypothetical protein K6C97_05655 [Treponema sp.]|nr:hypothetical protein [Treponema sp.]
MKIVSYNISACKQQKLDKIFEQKADVYVIPEMAKNVTIPDGYFMKWTGNYESKGLGIVYNNAVVTRSFDESLPYAIPVRYEDIFVLAFWPTKTEKNQTYTKLARQIIEHYADDLNHNDSIITGDFNLYHRNGTQNKTADILEINDLLNSLGFKSIYHKLRGEAFGSETEKTYFHQFKEENAFFLDYTYSNFPIKKYELLPWDNDFSDHRGQVIEF